MRIIRFLGPLITFSYGTKYSIEHTTPMSFKLIACQHRHCVFTIPNELRHYFLQDYSLLNSLFSAVRSVVLRMFVKISKSESFVLGFICVLPTLRRSLQWNPHIFFCPLQKSENFRIKKALQARHAFYVPNLQGPIY